MLVLASIVLCHAWRPPRAWSCLVTSNTHEALFGCNHLGSIFECQVTLYILFLFCLVWCYAYHVCLHHPLAFYAPVHACSHVHAWVLLLMCHPCFNTMKLWTFNPNLHLSLTHTTFCLLSCLFSFSLVCLPCLSCLSALCLFLILFTSFSSIAHLLVSCLCLCMYAHVARTHGAGARSPRRK